MTTIRILSSDFLESFNQTNPEKNVTLTQVAYWVTVLADQLKSQHIQKTDSRAYVHIFPEVPIEAETVAGKDDVPGRKYAKLPAAIYNFNEDRGIDYIAYCHDSDVCGRPGYTYQTFTRTNPSDSRALYMKKWLKPDVGQVYFMPLGEGKVYFLGLEESDVDKVEMGLFTSIDPLKTIDIDAEFDFPDHLRHVLTRQLYDLGRFVMLVPNDFKIDANPENAEGLSTQKLISVNDPSMQA